MSNTSDVDDPDVYESSGEEWDTSKDPEKKRGNRRASQRLSKKPKLAPKESESSEGEEEDEDEEEDDEPSQSSSEDDKSKAKNGVNKNKKSASKSFNKQLPVTVDSADFSTGSFLIMKKDAQRGDPDKHPCIWRVDGKSLLQKYEPYTDDGKIRHKSTSIYTGWSPLDKDQYAPVTVNIIEQSSSSVKVELHWDKLKIINMDSD